VAGAPTVQAITWGQIFAFADGTTYSWRNVHKKSALAHSTATGDPRRQEIANGRLSAIDGITGERAGFAAPPNYTSRARHSVGDIHRQRHPMGASNPLNNRDLSQIVRISPTVHLAHHSITICKSPVTMPSMSAS
jgi:hypothetical protein